MCCVSTAWGGCEVGTRVRHTGHASPDVQHGENSRVHGLGTAAEEPAGPVAARAPQPDRGAASAPSPVRPDRDRGNPGRPVARTWTAPAGPGQRMRMAATGPLRRLRGRSLSPGARPGRRLVPGRPGGHSHATGGRAAVPGERATASAGQPAKAETPGRALARPGLSGSSVIVSPLAAAGHRRREHASRLRRRYAAGWLPGIKYLAGREPVFVLGDE